MKPLKTVSLVWLIALWIIGIAFASFVLGSDIGHDKLDNRFGDVNWDHELHARGAVDNCQVCHHTTKANNANPQACSECHTKADIADSMFEPAPLRGMEQKGEKKAPKRRIAFHKKCIGCHGAVKEGPMSCRDCHAQKLLAEGGATHFDHIKYANEHNLVCLSCHEEHKNAVVKGKEWDDCQSCHKESHVHMGWNDMKRFDHTPLFKGKSGEVLWDHRMHKLAHFDAMADIEKVTCLSCHHQDKDLDPQNYRGCGDCHKSTAYKDNKGTKIASRKTALHKSCRKCHDSTRKDVPEAVKTSCNSCHRLELNQVRSEFGPITWSHDGHAGGGIDCNRCHHADPKDGPMRACRDCHFEGKVTNLNSLKHQTHTNCVECHSLDEPRVKDQVKWDNIKTCDVCHVPWPWTGIDKKHDIYEKEHEKLTMENVVHKVCWECHEEKGRGPSSRNCRACHAFPRERQQAMNIEEAEKTDLPSMQVISKDAYNVHRIHVNMGGAPCMDCHHNMKADAKTKAMLSDVSLFKDSNCTGEGATADSCKPGITDPQHCANCHDNAELSIAPATDATTKLCNECHKEFGLKPAGTE